MSRRLFLVFLDPGPGWLPGLTSRQQPDWDRHATFMEDLFARGRIVLGGPYADFSRVLVIVNAGDADEARGYFDKDPWNEAGILRPAEIVEWKALLDSREQGD